MSDPVEPQPFDAETAVASLPHLPGVYRMLDGAGDVLYVGKAIDLRKRVASYFQKRSALSPRIQLMVSQVAGLQTTVTRSEAEALLLENNLIKSLAPRYNILFRDDKSYPYIMVSDGTFPRIGFHRGATDKRSRYFGPFPSAGAVRESIQLLQKVFRVRTCVDTVFRNRSRPCLLHQIRRCTAPCVGLVSESSYGTDVANAVLFLSGKEDEVIRALEARMAGASADQRYEEAASCRDQIQALRKVRERQFVESGSGLDADVVACAMSDDVLCVNLVMIRGGRHLGDKSFFPQNAEGFDPATALEAFLAQHYVGQSVPPLVMTGVPVAVDALASVLSDQASRRVEIVTATRGERRVWLEMAERNAELALQQRIGERTSQEHRLKALQAALGLPDHVRRIECFDISHTMGEAAVASCVVYEGNSMQKGDYRRFNVTGIEPGDDYGAMRDVLDRRYRRIIAGEGRLPDLVLIDGGRGQLAVATTVLAELGLGDLPVVGVAKGESRKPGLEQLILPDREEPVMLGGEHPGLHLVQQIRDEAHRFAIAGHRAKRGRARRESPLESIPGVGAKRRQRLLARFGGLKGLLAANADDLAQVEGISTELAERIYRALR